MKKRNMETVESGFIVLKGNPGIRVGTCFDTGFMDKMYKERITEENGRSERILTKYLSSRQ